MTLTLRYAARSDRGLIRDGNQDSVYAGPRLLAVADGMGGMAAGDVASNIVIGAMAPLDEDVPGSALVDALRNAVESANQQLRDTVDANPQMEGMGTTLTAALFSGSKFGMVHIGDSRAYLLRDGEFSQITKDDTYVQMLVDEGRISPEEASSHPQRSLLTRALDGRDIDPEYSVRQVLPGDRYLICSDGLSAVVSADTIADTLREYVDPQQCVERLVQLALRGGGPDNITVVVADATDGDILELAPMVGGAAAGDRGLGAVTDTSTPAARASALNPPRSASPEGDGQPDEPAEETADRPRRHPVRTAVLSVVLLGVLAGGVWGGWQYTQSQYYVGATDDGKLAVFQGVPGEIAGFALSNVRETSNAATLDDLTVVAQERVKQGIIANDRTDAERRLDELTADTPSNPNLKPECQTAPPVAVSPTPTSSPSTAPASPSAGPTGSASAPAGSSISATGSPTPTAPPTPSAAATPAPDAPPVVDPASCRPAG
ncbi:PP2C family protein-serine/threonine phosphatase [Catenuloplanes atrovinosus]|uniref:Serine/threonine protein phosphatase PstP n=1 Tax=Catenuloplanes atrovinosus TaxID=137266 RepID=A0AAE4CCZ0_9ACTN|nr:protein phosphatase 2C domain-containing protein [Catenuloplanes atrovinosus]MDR7280106.1 protein phosphatase [Catenuloplanes atrovinosus]